MAQKRKTLTRMDDPYNGIILILELVGMHCPTLIELEELVVEEKEARGLRVQYNSGKEDVLYFCWHQLGIVELVGEHFKLTETGERLRRYLYTPAFSEELLQALVEASLKRFTYFYQVYSALNQYARKGVTTLTHSTLQALLDETNSVSKKEIKRLLIACRAIAIGDDMVSLNPHLLGIDPAEVQVTQLLNSIARMIEREGRLVYSDTVKQLEMLHPEIDIRKLEFALRKRLWLNAARTVEYIDGIR